MTVAGPGPRGAIVFTLALLSTAACTESKKLDAKDRAAVVAPEAVAWRPAAREDVLGYFESERITGEAAASVRRVYYSFAADGTYTGAALVQDGARAAFQTLSGRWTLAGQALSLGSDAAPARAFAAPDRLRLDSDGGVAYFRRGRAD